MTARRLPWSLFAGSMAASVAGVVLLGLVPAQALRQEGDSLLLSSAFVVVLVVFGLVGAIVASRLPSNPIGWLFLVLFAINGFYELAYAYTHYSLAVEPLPGFAYAAWLSNWVSPLSPVLIALSCLLFPDGHLPSSRWRPVGWFCVLTAVPIFVHFALAPGPVTEFPSVANPVGITGATFLVALPVDPLLAAMFLAAMAAVVVRFRRSRGVERQQLKWFALSAALIAVFLLVATVWESVRGAATDDAESQIGGMVFAVILCGLPVSAGLAVLKYRLYDVDLVINRTLVYGALTATLLLAYLGGVLLLQPALSPLTDESDLAVAVSTLAVAALFRPVRSGIQDLVDRRFYRRRYDAARTVAEFSGRLRREIDLPTVGADLRHVVGDAVQPTHVSLWLRGTP